MGAADYWRLLRPWQWYKNLLVFIAVFFTGNLFNPAAWAIVIIGFFSLCLVSSSGYIINDIYDKKLDALHHRKRNRPLASGAVPEENALVLSLALYAAGGLLSYFTGSFPFFILLSCLFLIYILYSFRLKHEQFIDMITIGVNFVLRAVSGALILHVFISPWLVLGAFFTALFLASGKRFAELGNDVPGDAYGTGQPSAYSPDDSKIIADINLASMVLVMMCYSLYSFLKAEMRLLFTLPVFTYLVLRMRRHISKREVYAKQPHMLVKDRPFVWGASLLFLMTVILFYLV